MSKIFCLLTLAAFAWLAVYADHDLHDRQYMAHHHKLKPLATEMQIKTREYNQALLTIYK